MIQIDGSYGEGGGQMIRTAVALSAITGYACRIENIRAGRPNPGIQPQHLAAVESVAKLCRARTDVKLGNTSLVFEPSDIEGGHYEIDIGTAGSISLVLQSLVLPSLHAKGHVSLAIRGGTHVRWSPTMDYMKKVFAYYMDRMGIDFSVSIERCGFYPKGGGLVTARIKPSVLKPLKITDRGSLLGYDATSVASESLRKHEVAERQIDAAEDFFDFREKEVGYAESNSPGSSICLSAVFENCVIGSSTMGDRGKKAEDVGGEAAAKLKSFVDGPACLDENMADQILPFLAFAKSSSEIRVAEVTGHVRTNIWVIEQFLPVKIEVDEKERIIKVNM